MIVRQAVEQDFPQIIELGAHFYEQAGYKDVPYSREGADKWCRFMLDCGLLVVAEQDGRIVGVVGGVAAPLLINPDYTTGGEVLWWVEPEYRSSGVGDAMLDEIEAAAKRVGVVYWSMMALEHMRPEAVGRIYERRGYQARERTWVKCVQ